MQAAGPYRLQQRMSSCEVGDVWSGADDQGRSVTVAVLNERASVDDRWRDAFAAAADALAQAGADPLPILGSDHDTDRPWVACAVERGAGAAQIFVVLGQRMQPAAPPVAAPPAAAQSVAAHPAATQPVSARPVSAQPVPAQRSAEPTPAAGRMDLPDWADTTAVITGAAGAGTVTRPGNVSPWELPPQTETPTEALNPAGPDAPTRPSTPGGPDDTDGTQVLPVVTTRPISGQPVSAQPVSGPPVSAQPVSAQPVSAQPVSAQPVSAQPVSAQPVSGQPVSAQPVSAAQSDAAPPQSRPGHPALSTSASPTSPSQFAQAEPEQAQPEPGNSVPGQPYPVSFPAGGESAAAPVQQPYPGPFVPPVRPASAPQSSAQQAPDRQTPAQQAPAPPEPGYPTTGYPGSGSPGSGYPASGYPASGYSAPGYPTSGYPSSGYPAAGYPASGYPASGSPAAGEPISAQPASGRPAPNPFDDRFASYPGPGDNAPTSGYPFSAPPVSGSPDNYQRSRVFGDQTPAKPKRSGLLIAIVAVVALLIGVGGGVGGMALAGRGKTKTPAAPVALTPAQLLLPATAPSAPGVEPPLGGGWPPTSPTFTSREATKPMNGLAGIGFDFRIPPTWTCIPVELATAAAHYKCGVGEGDQLSGGDLLVRTCEQVCNEARRTFLRQQQEAWGLRWTKSGPFVTWAETTKPDGKDVYGLVYIAFWRSTPEGPVDRELVLHMTSPPATSNDLKKVVNSVRDRTFTL